MDEDVADPEAFELTRPGRANWQVDSRRVWAEFPNYPSAIATMASIVKGEVELVLGLGGAMAGLSK